MYNATLDSLLNRARTTTMTPQDREQQRRDLAFGNVAFMDPRVTRESIDRAAESIGAQDDPDGSNPRRDDSPRSV